MNRKMTLYRSARRAAVPVLLALGAVVWTGGELQSQSPVDCRTRSGFDKQICVVSGRITSDTTFDAGSYWVLRGAVFVEDGATLTLDPGTEVFGEFATNGTLVIAQGGQIHSNGTALRTGRVQQRPGGRRARPRGLGRAHHQRPGAAQRARRDVRG